MLKRLGMLGDHIFLLLFVYVFFIVLETFLTCNHCDIPENARIRESVDSKTYKYIIVIEMTASVLLLADLLSDNIANFKEVFVRKGCLVMLVILSLLLISSALILFYAIPHNHLGLIQHLHELRIMCILCATSSYANYYSKKFWPKLALIPSIVCFGLGFVVFNFSKHHGDNADKASLSLLVLSSFIFIAIHIRWIFYIKNQQIKTKHITDEDWKVSVYTSSFVCFLLVFWITNVIIHGHHKPLNEYEVSDLLAYEISFTIFVFIQMINTKHITKRAVVRFQDELEFKRMFVRYISHEVRTPLNTAIMGLQVLLEEMESKGDHEGIETVEDIRKSCNIAVNILNELLTFDKLQAGTLMLEKTEVAAITLLQDTVQPFQIQAKQSGVHLLVIPQLEDSDTPHILVDSNKIQVIRNMVSNALKFTPRDGTVQVILSVLHDHKDKDGVVCDMVKIDVVDSGAGISLENQQRLFKEVVQFNPGKLQKGGGSGLGLYISHGIASLHEGDLSVHSAGEGEGSTFTLLLPCYFDTQGSHVSMLSTPRIAPELEVESSPTTVRNNPRTELEASLDARINSKVALKKDSSESKSPKGKMDLKDSHPLRQPITHRQAKGKDGINTPHHVFIDESQPSKGDSHILGSIKVSANSSLYYGDGRGGSMLWKGEDLVDRSSSGKSIHESIYESPLVSRNNKKSMEMERKDLFEFLKTDAPLSSAQSSPSSSSSLDLHALARIGSQSNPSLEGLSNQWNGRKRSLPSIAEADSYHSSAENGNNPTKPTQSAILFDPMSTSQQNITALIVDDSPSNRKMQCRLLRKRCGMCLEADDGQVALDMIKNSLNLTWISEPTSRIDVVLMDGNMPNMDGREATRKMREAGYHGVVIGVTGDVASDDIKSFLKAGADVVLPKPLDVRSFDVVMNKFFLYSRQDDQFIDGKWEF